MVQSGADRGRSDISCANMSSTSSAWPAETAPPGPETEEWEEFSWRLRRKGLVSCCQPDHCCIRDAEREKERGAERGSILTFCELVPTRTKNEFFVFF